MDKLKLKENIVVVVALVALVTSIIAMGTPGVPGIPGIQGVQGVVGVQGEQGVPGVQGVSGTVGNQGPVGPAGPAGPEGERGDKGAEGDELTHIPSLNTLSAMNKGASFYLLGSGFKRAPKIEFMDSSGKWYDLGTAQLFDAGLIRESLVIPATAFSGTGSITADSSRDPKVSLAVTIN